MLLEPNLLQRVPGKNKMGRTGFQQGQTGFQQGRILKG